MGRYNFAPQRVHSHATQLLQAKRISSPPPWYNIIGTFPPPERLVRPPLQRPQKPGSKRSSRLFKPLHLHYEEDKLRWEFFNDHPWELAKPRVILENDGRDGEKWDWSLPLDSSLSRPGPKALNEEGVDLELRWEVAMKTQSGRPLNAEAVIQRQKYLMSCGLSRPAAYDRARKEYYRVRHFQETETRVAREEALATGSYFGLGPLEIGMKLEDQQYENWKSWAAKEIAALKQLQGSAYTGNEAEESTTVGELEGEAPELQEVSESVPGSRTGQVARGGAAMHP